MNKTGQKFDEGKLPIGRVLQQFPRAIKALAMCSLYGNKKYKLDTDWQNFRRVENPYDRYNDAEGRHKLEHNEGQVLDPESGLPHEFHALWNDMAKIECKLELQEKANTSKTNVLSQIDEICEEWDNDKNLDTETFYNNIMSVMGYNT